MKLYMDRMFLLVAAELLYAQVGVVASDESVERFTLYRLTAFESTSDVKVQEAQRMPVQWCSEASTG